MTTTLIVLAHPEPASFNAAWARRTAQAAEDLGHRVLWSDLCAMAFDPVESPAHYPAPAAATPFDPLKMQENAARTGTLPADILREIDKIRAADRIVLHFPLWWFGPPAILKGWCDRVLAHGALHSVDRRFDTGQCAGKSALFCVTSGSSAAESAPDGKEGDIGLLLWPLAYTLRYLGFSVLRPVAVHDVHGYHKGAAARALEARLAQTLADQPRLVAGFDRLPRMTFNPDTDFDSAGRLKPDAPSHTPFIRHRS